MDMARFKIVLDHIERNPKTWYQKLWHSVGRSNGDRAEAPDSSCGTAHCFAGHAQLLAGKKRDDKTAQQDACRYLGLPEVPIKIAYGAATNIIWLFKSDRTLEDFHAVADGSVEPLTGLQLR